MKFLTTSLMALLITSSAFAVSGAFGHDKNSMSGFTYSKTMQAWTCKPSVYVSPGESARFANSQFAQNFLSNGAVISIRGPGYSDFKLTSRNGEVAHIKIGNFEAVAGGNLLANDDGSTISQIDPQLAQSVVNGVDITLVTANIQKGFHEEPIRITLYYSEQYNPRCQLDPINNNQVCDPAPQLLDMLTSLIVCR